MRKSDLPFGSEFSPSQVDLSEVLGLARAHGGDWRAFEAAVRGKYFEGHKTDDYNRAKLANNTKLGMQAYGIIDDDARLTPLGEQLYAQRENERALYEALARHILLELHGMDYIHCLFAMRWSGEEVTLARLRDRLEDRGIHVPGGGRHLSCLRLWLEKAGILASGYRVDERRLIAIVRTSIDRFGALATCGGGPAPHSKTGVRDLRIGPSVPGAIGRHVTATCGMGFDGQDPARNELVLEYCKGIVADEDVADGCGAASYLVALAPRHSAGAIAALLAQTDHPRSVALAPYFQRPVRELVDLLASKNERIRTPALRALAQKIANLLDLERVRSARRYREGSQLGTCVTLRSKRPPRLLWEVWCRVARQTELEDVAMAVGLARRSRPDVVAILTDGRFTGRARWYASRAMAACETRIILLDRSRLGKMPSGREDLEDFLADTSDRPRVLA